MSRNHNGSLNVMRKYFSFRRIALLLIVLCFAFIWSTDAPDGLSLQGWHMLNLFITTIVAIMLNVYPIGITALIAVTFAIIAKLMTVDAALSGFGSPVVWLVVMAFFISRSLIKTGLGARMSYYMITKFGKTGLGLSYSLVSTELLLAPAIPSASARAGGVILPIVRSLIREYLGKNYEDLSPNDKKENKICNYFILLCFHANVITSAMFLTAMAANPLIVKLASGYKIHISWGTWALGAIVPGLINLLVLPILLTFLCNPKISHGTAVIAKATQSLLNMGKIKKNEGFTFMIFVFLICMWALDRFIGIDSTTVAITGFLVLFLGGVLSWDDIMNEKGAWESLIWFSILMTLAGALYQMGVAEWFTSKVSGSLSGNHPYKAVIILALIFFFAHYFFASITVHSTVMYTTFLGLFLQLGVVALPAAMALAYLSVLSASLTHYGISSAPIFFGTGYVSVPTWWRISLIVGITNLLIWVVVGRFWWKILGWF